MWNVRKTCRYVFFTGVFKGWYAFVFSQYFVEVTFSWLTFSWLCPSRNRFCLFFFTNISNSGSSDREHLLTYSLGCVSGTLSYWKLNLCPNILWETLKFLPELTCICLYPSSYELNQLFVCWRKVSPHANVASSLFHWKGYLFDVLYSCPLLPFFKQWIQQRSVRYWFIS